MDQNINDSKSYTWNPFLKTWFRPNNICPDVPVDIIRVFFFISDFLEESLRANKNKLSLILQYSIAQKTLLILRNWTYLTLKKICSCNTSKNLSETFQQICFRLVSEKIFALHHFLTLKNCILQVLWSTLHSWSKYLYSFIYLLKKFFFERRSKWRVGRKRLSSLWKTEAFCLGLAKWFTIFPFNWNFWKFNYSF